MNKAALALTFALLVSLVIQVHFALVAEGNPYQGADDTSWTIFSPKNHTTYNTDRLTFNFTCTTNDLWNEFDDGLDLEYCIDGSDYWQEYEEGKFTHVMPPDEERIFINATLISDPAFTRKTFHYSALLPSLSEGEHRLTIYYEFKSWGPDKPEFTSTQWVGITFYIDALAPKITNLSINGSGMSDRLLSFTVDEETSWLGYSLDNQANVTINGNTTLTGLSEGGHALIVYANSTSGNMGSSQTVNFTVSPEIQPTPLPGPFSTTIVIVSVIVAAIAAMGLLVYFKRFHRDKNR